MRVLLINCCGTEGCVAVAEGDSVMAVELLAGRGTSESLFTAMRRLLAAGPVEAVGVVHGPGSFTGVRVGLSAAKGLCDALGVGMVAMSRLALVAGPDGIGILDAGRGEYFVGLYERGQCVYEQLLKADEVRGRGGLTCEPKVAEALGLALFPEPGAEEMLAMFLKRVAAGQWADVATIDANYLRRTDAEILVEGK
jgi:tRNA threonylcarbamoyladenosine biosynthesis protein TsaB